MKVYCWERLKEQVMLRVADKFPTDSSSVLVAKLYALLASLEHGADPSWKRNYDNLYELCAQRVRAWDIRRAKSLLDLFPGIIPAKFANQIPTAEISDQSGDWVLIYEE